MILDTFYLLFKSDSKEVTKDITELEKKVDSLREKGKKRTEQESKDYKEYQKQLKEKNGELKEQQQTYDRLTDSVAKYAAGFFSLNAVKSSFLDTVQSNAALQNQADLLGQNSAELKAYGAAAKAAGGSAEALYGYSQALFERFANLGLKTPEISEVFSKIREQLKLVGNDPAQRERIFQLFGVPQDIKTLLSLSDEDYTRAVAQGQALTSNIAEAGKASKEFAAIWAGYDQTIDDINTKLSSKLLPIIKSIYTDAVTGGRWLANIFSPVGGDNSDSSSTPPPGESSTPNKKTSLTYDRNKDLAFWQSQGYTKEQAAAWVAAEEAESGGNARAIGDNGQALGLFQWHKARREEILKGTGIDIKSATHEEQLRAAAWEAEQRGDASLIKGQSTPQGAAAIHTRFFERPADIAGESIRRGQAAIDIANNTPISSAGGGSKSTSVKIGEVNVHSAAADASGIAKDIASELERQTNLAISNMDDGVKY